MTMPPRALEHVQAKVVVSCPSCGHVMDEHGREVRCPNIECVNYTQSFLTAPLARLDRQDMKRYEEQQQWRREQKLSQYSATYSISGG